MDRDGQRHGQRRTEIDRDGQRWRETDRDDRQRDRQKRTETDEDFNLNSPIHLINCTI